MKKEMGTYDVAFQACDSYFMETGEMPTIDVIRNLIGVNSPNTISGAIKAWKKELSSSIIKSNKKAMNAPGIIVDAVNSLWDLAKKEAWEGLSERIKKMDDREAELIELENNIKNEAEKLRNSFNDKEVFLRNEIDELKIRICEINKENNESKKIINEIKDKLGEARKDNAILIEKIKSGDQMIEKMEKRLDTEHEWALKRIDEEKNIISNELQGKIIKAEGDALRSKQDYELCNSKLSLEIKKNSEHKGKIKEMEIELLRTKLMAAEGSLYEGNNKRKIGGIARNKGRFGIKR